MITFREFFESVEGEGSWDKVLIQDDPYSKEKNDPSKSILPGELKVPGAKGLFKRLKAKLKLKMPNASEEDISDLVNIAMSDMGYGKSAYNFDDTPTVSYRNPTSTITRQNQPPPEATMAGFKR